MGLMNIPFQFRKKSHPLGLLYGLTSLFEYRKVQTLRCDYNIIGNNPIMQLFFLYFLSLKLKNSKEFTTVLFSINSQIDYWKYSEVENPIFFQKISEIIQEKVSNIYEFINLVIRRIPQDKIKIYYHENELFPNYYRYDEILKQTILVYYPFSHTFKKNKENHSEVVLIDNNVKDNIFMKMNEYLQALGLINKIKNLHPQEEFKVFSKKTLLTSLPQGWIESKAFKHQDLLPNEMCFLNHFSSKGEVVASSYHISTDIKESIILAHEDLKNCQKVMNNIIYQ